MAAVSEDHLLDRFIEGSDSSTTKARMTKECVLEE